MDEYLQHFLEFQETMYKGNYMIHIDDLVRMCRDFQADCFDGFVSNDKAWVENWIEKHGV